MADEMMRVAGRGTDGTAKPIYTELREEVLLDAVTIPAGGSEQVNINTTVPYRLYLTRRANADKSWRLDHLARIGGITLAASSRKPILGSNGEELINGYGARSHGLTELFTPIGATASITVNNTSDTDSPFTLVKIDYPYSAIDMTNQMFKKEDKRNFYVNYHGALDGQEVFISNELPSKIDYLEFATDSINGCQVYIEFYKEGSYQSIGGVYSDGSGVSGFTPRTIVEQNMGLWHVKAYGEGHYKFSLNRALEFNEGLRIRASGTGANVAIRAYGVENHD